MGKGFTVENHQLNALLDGLVRDVNSNNDSVKTIRQTLISVEGTVGDLETQVATGDIDGGAAASVFTTDQVLDGGGA